MRTLLLAAAAGLLAACATATPYQSAGPAGAYGFSEQRIESNRMRITFSGNSLTDRDTVETYLLYRAAEVTLENGFDYFVVAQRDTEANSRLQGTGPVFPYSYRYFHPRHGWAPWYDPFWNEPMNYREVTRYEAIAEIAMFNGAKPANDPSAYAAREVQANLQARIARPPAS
ncbi:MAG: hypothetical protein AB7O98_09870 [Hyphomonadaceae bacterium]